MTLQDIIQIKQDRMKGVMLCRSTIDRLIDYALAMASIQANKEKHMHTIESLVTALQEQTELAEALRLQAETLKAELRVARPAFDLNAIAKKVMDDIIDEGIAEKDDEFRAGKTAGVIALKVAIKAATPPAIEAPQALSDEQIDDAIFAAGVARSFAYVDAPNDYRRAIRNLIAVVQPAATPAAQASAPQQHAQAALSIGAHKPFEQAAKELHQDWTPEKVNHLIAVADAYIASQQPAAAPAAPTEQNFYDLVTLGLSSIKQDYSPECLQMASTESYVEDAVVSLVKAGWRPTGDESHEQAPDYIDSKSAAAPAVQVQDELADAAVRVRRADAAYKAQSNFPAIEEAQEYQAAVSALVAAALTKGQQ